jgi:Tfp pilus assembly protein PilO
MLFGRSQQIIIGLVAGVIVCVFVIFWYRPLREEMRIIKHTRAEQMMTLAKGTADAEQLPALGEQLRKMQTELQDYESKIPSQRDFGAFLGRITDLMNENNLEEQSIEPGAVVEVDKFNCIPLSMKCKGGLRQIYNFYTRLQSLGRLVRIEQVRLSNDPGYDGQVSMETKAVIYYRAAMG